MLVVAAVVGWHFVYRFALSQLEFSELKVGNLPHIPMQPTAALIQCSSGLDMTLNNANGYLPALTSRRIFFGNAWKNIG